MFKLRKRRGAVQFTQFSMIGIMNGAIDLLALNGLLWAWPTKDAVYLFLFNSIAYTLAVVNSYFWNSRLTFRREAYFSAREKSIFAIQAAVSLLISNGTFLLFEYWIQMLPVSVWIVHNASKGLSMAFSASASFFFMKYFVFRGKRKLA